MSRGDLKIKKQRGKQAEVSFDAKLSQDKRTFVLVVESDVRMSWYEAVQATMIYARDEFDQLIGAGAEGEDPREH